MYGALGANNRQAEGEGTVGLLLWGVEAVVGLRSSLVRASRAQSEAGVSITPHAHRAPTTRYLTVHDKRPVVSELSGS